MPLLRTSERATSTGTSVSYRTPVYAAPTPTLGRVATPPATYSLPFGSDLPQWRFVLTDLKFVPQAELLNISGRNVGIPLNRIPSLSFTCKLSHPQADRLISLEGYIKAYRSDELMFYGPLVSAEETAERDTQSISVTAAGGAWIFSHREVGKSTAGTTFTNQDRAEIIRLLLATANTENETHIDSTGTVGAASKATYVAGPYKPLLETITDLGTALDGFDWQVFPIDNFDNGVVTGQKIGEFEAVPLFGQARPEAIFTYGSLRANVESYKRQNNREQQANKTYHLDPSGSSLPAKTGTNAASVTKWGWLEAIAEGDIYDAALRQQLVDEHSNIRGEPRNLIDFTPHIDPFGLRVPQFGRDFFLGDIIRGRAEYQSRVRFDTSFRVWGASFEITDLGIEKPTITLSEEA